MKKALVSLLLVGVAAVMVWGVLRKGDPPKVSFARVMRQTLVSTLPTNGKVEPWLWQAVRAETGGGVSSAPVEDGQTVAAGALHRKESRGSHARVEHTARDDVNFLKHTLAYRTEGLPRLSYIPVARTKWEPMERKY